ncbi:MAG: RNA polymerase sigma factor [Spirochaetia bacterium]|nr:RNA polymerase sigma factor [Spirochaetia bacterium]
MKILDKPERERTSESWEGLVAQSLAGDRQALDDLLRSVQPLVFNLAQKMLLNPDDAQDATQEILLKLVLGLQSYDSQKAEFTTWAYALARNQILGFRIGKIEALTGSFDQYAEEIQAVSDKVIEERELLNPETQILVKEANVGCMLGMLLCLSRDQRMVFILGEMFALKSEVAARICELTPENFRKQLSRARRDLYSFMQNKCGLINKENPCRCHRKTAGFIKAGYVDPQNIRFATHYYQNVRIFSEERVDAMCDVEVEYGKMYRNLPVYDADTTVLAVKAWLNSLDFRDTFRM